MSIASSPSAHTRALSEIPMPARPKRTPSKPVLNPASSIVRGLSRDVPRAVAAAVHAAVAIAGVDGEVVGGMSGLQVALGHDSAASTRRLVGLAEQLGLMRRVGVAGGQTGPIRLFVVESRLNIGACETPGCTRAPTGRWCPSCRQVHRADREWRHRAVEMAVAGASVPIIAGAVGHPTSDVVRHLLGEVPDLVDPAWRDAWREATPNADVTRATRLRRHRAKAKAEQRDAAPTITS